MSSELKEKNYTGLSVSYYDSDNIYPLLPLLSEEFPNWTLDKIKNYVKLVVSKKPDVAGMLVAKNEAFYNVGLLIYTFQSVSTKYLYTDVKEEFTNGLMVENIVASGPILKQQIFLIIVESAIDIAKKNNCKFIELPKFDETYKLVNEKYHNKIIKINNFRTAIDLS
mgnify:FL=1